MPDWLMILLGVLGWVLGLIMIALLRGGHRHQHRVRRRGRDRSAGVS